MTLSRRASLWCAIVVVLPACVEGIEAGESEHHAGGSGDKNSPHWNWYLDQLRRRAEWAPETTGPNTVSGLSDFAFEWRDEPSACGDGPRLAVVGSRTVGDRTIGSEALVEEPDGSRRSMAVLEQITAPAWMVSSDGTRDRVALELVRARDLPSPDAPWLVWPQYGLIVRAEDTCEELARAVVQFGASYQMPFDAASDVDAARDRFVAYASLYRNEHAALVAKAAVKGAIPGPIAGEPDEGFLVACDHDEVAVAALDTARNTAFALGNGAWTHLPGDPRHHAVQVFLTEEGFPIDLYAGAVVPGHAPRMVDLCWGRAVAPEHAGRPLPRLALPTTTLTVFDAIHASDLALAANDRAAGLPTAIARGADQSRVAAFLESSEHPDAARLVAQVTEAAAAARLGEVSAGALTSWQVARTVLTPRVAQVSLGARTSGFYATGISGFDRPLPEVAGDGICGPREGGCAGDDPALFDAYSCVLACDATSTGDVPPGGGPHHHGDLELANVQALPSAAESF